MADRDDSAITQDEDTLPYEGPSGGWGSLRAISSIFGKELDTPEVIDLLRRQNKPGGFMCVSCAWTKPAKPCRDPIRPAARMPRRLLPELNPLVPLGYHEELSKTPAYKGVPVRIVA